MMGGGGFGGAGAGAGGAPADTRPASEKYADQLKQIKDMGFSDEETILAMLEQANGNVNLVLERLFQ
jgi:hypothetical protein